MSKRGVPKKDPAHSAPFHVTRRGHRLSPVVGAIALAAVAATISLWPEASTTTGHAYALAPESALPPSVRRAPPSVREAYRFAIANRETLRWIPCFCGCAAEGHTNNADCYIKDVRPDGAIEFDFMSLG